MIAFDSSALVKLVQQEAESDALEAWLAGRQADWTASELCRVEVARAARRSPLPATRPAAQVLSALDLVPMSAALLDRAAELAPPSLRSLDAIHLASALELGAALEAFLVYDEQLADAARAHGLPVVRPA